MWEGTFRISHHNNGKPLNGYFASIVVSAIHKRSLLIRQNPPPNLKMVSPDGICGAVISLFLNIKKARILCD